MKYKKLNEVLIEWNESSKEDSDNIILNQKDIADNLAIPYKFLTYEQYIDNLHKIKKIFSDDIFPKISKKLGDTIELNYKFYTKDGYQGLQMDWDTWGEFTKFYYDIPLNLRPFREKYDNFDNFIKMNFYTPWSPLYIINNSHFSNREYIYTEITSPYYLNTIVNELKATDKFIYNTEVLQDNSHWKYYFFIYKNPIGKTGSFLWFYILIPPNKNGTYHNGSLSVITYKPEE